jgi:hypothetical protein
LAVISRPSAASTASVNVPPTSTPRSIHRTAYPARPITQVTGKKSVHE